VCENDDAVLTVD